MDLQGLGDGNGGFEYGTSLESNPPEPRLSSKPIPSPECLLLRRKVPEKSRSGILISLASLSLITSLQGSCNNGNTSFRHMSETPFPSTSRSWSFTFSYKNISFIIMMKLLSYFLVDFTFWSALTLVPGLFSFFLLVHFPATLRCILVFLELCLRRPRSPMSVLKNKFKK